MERRHDGNLRAQMGDHPVIVGHGAIAQAIEDREDRLYFASGVSNSYETRESEYEREYQLLCSQRKDLRLVYFSSLLVFTSDRIYSRHKRAMEDFVKSHFPRWTIMRLGNITWATNPNQLFPFLKSFDESEPLDERYRYVLTEDEFRHWLSLIPEWNCEMNITGVRLKPIEILRIIKEANETADIVN